MNLSNRFYRSLHAKNGAILDQIWWIHDNFETLGVPFHTTLVFAVGFKN